MTTKLTISVADYVAAKLDRHVNERKLSRSEVIEEFIVRGLEQYHAN